ncbi:MAG: ribosomal-processing cysteine protease Prp [Bacilli bacterium]|nr:ribosomal-processing cysteine protease Prp [Bacilli bacterium]
MIKVTIDDLKIKIKGHALYANFGQDIVCASVSSIVITSVNALIRIDKDAISVNEDEGFVQIDIKKKDKIVQIIIDNMISLLDELEHKYPKNIKIIKGGADDVKINGA